MAKPTAARKTIPNPNQRTASAADSEIFAPAVLGLGSVAWKGLAAWEHVDFVLSIKEERIAMAFDLFETTGWWLLLAASLAWILIRRPDRIPTHLVPSWALLTCCSIITFLFGVLLAVMASGGVPTILVGWGSPDPTKCIATLDTSKLKSFKGSYRVAFICGITDPSIDRMEEDRVTVSNTFTIIEGPIVISAVMRPQMSTFVSSMAPRPVEVWYEAILLPTEVTSNKISKMSDVTSIGGKILRQQFFK